MKVYLAIKYHEDHSNEDHIEGILSVLERERVDTCCVARDLERWGTIEFTSDELMRRSFQEIDSSDVVLVDLTEKGVGVGIEAGYAFSKGLPILTIALAGSDISTTLQGISTKVVSYVNYDDLSTLLDDLNV